MNPKACFGGGRKDGLGGGALPSLGAFRAFPRPLASGKSHLVATGQTEERMHESSRYTVEIKRAYRPTNAPVTSPPVAQERPQRAVHNNGIIQKQNPGLGKYPSDRGWLPSVSLSVFSFFSFPLRFSVLGGAGKTVAFSVFTGADRSIGDGHNLAFAPRQPTDGRLPILFDEIDGMGRDSQPTICHLRTDGHARRLEDRRRWNLALVPMIGLEAVSR